MLYTGPAEETQEDLAQSSASARGRAATARTSSTRVTQEEGSRIFDLESDAPQNSWLARRGATCR